MLTLVPDGEQPRSLLVGPKLSYMDERIAAIERVALGLLGANVDHLAHGKVRYVRLQKRCSIWGSRIPKIQPASHLSVRHPLVVPAFFGTAR